MANELECQVCGASCSLQTGSYSLHYLKLDHKQQPLRSEEWQTENIGTGVNGSNAENG
ncbi:hypothetical protein DL89DRAFT_270305 [Linderina pennispora]|uniref:Uncharacterized protein n=1 Tax=Linderina pennispora TaxID=61395 RepID=A0A1Y1VXU3_9FUNG|nr:uncharacterized protein DL89DRAFT_270305 [Linderina pennispora]ORX66110.1 hypothetical protein DL89DRAFT_270305 [Linderina pennispora]